ADEVRVISCKAQEKEVWEWLSDGQGSYKISSSTESKDRGVKIILKLKEDCDDFLEKIRLEHIVRTWSNHVQIPIFITSSDDDKDSENKQINSANALWAKPKSEITDEQYQEFFRSITYNMLPPWKTIHFKTEGLLEYTALLFIPAETSVDLFDQQRKVQLALYVNRVFITDNMEGLLPGWLRFLRGLIDSQDLPLNVSREMLQKEPRLAKIQKALVKRVLSELDKNLQSDAKDYDQVFWKHFGMVLKEGLYEGYEDPEAILKISRFKSWKTPGWTNLDAYIEEMQEDQEDIYYISADTEGAARQSPQLEAFQEKNVNVLLLHDPVDEFWSKMIPDYKGKKFVSITQSEIDLGHIKGQSDSQPEAPKLEENKGIELSEAIKAILQGKVSDVRVSKRLTTSPICLIAAEGGQDLRMQRLLKNHRNPMAEMSQQLPILEINTAHPIIQKLSEMETPDSAVCNLLFSQAAIQQGILPEDTTEFSGQLNMMIQKALSQ
ncbi:MAG: molecular chaperone HtpG, partial [Pseudomonadota bacterium]